MREMSRVAALYIVKRDTPGAVLIGFMPQHSSPRVNRVLSKEGRGWR